MRITAIGNINAKEAERIGARPGRRIEHIKINPVTGKAYLTEKGEIVKLYRFFFMAVMRGKSGYEFRECFPYYLLNNQDRTERLYIKE